MDHSSKPTGPTPSDCASLTPQDASELEQLAENSAQILIVSARQDLRSRIGELLSECDCSVRAVVGAEQAQALMLEGVVDLVLIDRAIGDHDTFDLCASCSGAEPGVVTIVLADDPSFEDAIQAMRSGAVDLLPSNIGSVELFEHVNAGLDRARHLRKRERRALRLRGLCLRLNAARQEVSQHVGELCSDLVEAYQDLSGQIDHIGIASELNSLLRQELDLECLLRTTLEYLLSKIGSTNAAIFLPSSSGEFSLGAYVNYDRAKDEAEVMLDHLAAVLAPRFEKRTDSAWLRDAEQVAACLEDESHWLEESETLIVPCHETGECLAVLIAFRDRNSPFVDEDHHTIEVLGDLFGKQLARVINVHHRHMPKNQWGLDEGDLAA